MTSSAEFNFHSDPESAYIVLHYAKCPITILPWEPCMDSTITFVRIFFQILIFLLVNDFFTNI